MLRRFEEFFAKQGWSIQNYFSYTVTSLANIGFNKQDLPKAIVCHEALGVIILALTWSACYVWPMSQNPLLMKPISRIKNYIPVSTLSKISAGIEKFPVNPRITESYIESSCFRKIVRPITIPGKLWLTLRLLRFHAKTESNSNNIFT